MYYYFELSVNWNIIFIFVQNQNQNQKMLKISTSFGYLVVESKRIKSNLPRLYIYPLFYRLFSIIYQKELLQLLCIDNFMLLVTACFTLLLLQLFFFFIYQETTNRKGFVFQTNFTTKANSDNELSPADENIYFSLSCYLYGDHFIEFENLYRSL